MFESRKKEYAVASPQASYDDYNYRKRSYLSEGTARICIIVQDRTLTTNNDLNLYEGTHVGYTDDMRIDKNWQIDDRFIVVSTLPHRNENILYLRELSDSE